MHQHEAYKPYEQDAELSQRANTGDEQDIREKARAKNTYGIYGNQNR
jgi:hypothetical protein